MRRKIRTALWSKHHDGHREATEEKGDPKIPGKKIWKKKYGRQVSSTAGGKTAQDKTGLRLWSKAYAPLDATRHESSKSVNHSAVRYW